MGGIWLGWVTESDAAYTRLWVLGFMGFLGWVAGAGGAYCLMSVWSRRPVRRWAYASRRTLLCHWLAGDMAFLRVAGVGAGVVLATHVALLTGLVSTPARLAVWSLGNGGVLVMLVNTGRREYDVHLRGGRILVAGLVSLQVEVLCLAWWAAWLG